MCVNKFVNKKGAGIQAFYVDKNEKYMAEKYLLYAMILVRGMIPGYSVSSLARKYKYASLSCVNRYAQYF